MAQNMSYCRFENTYFALQECLEAMDAGKIVSEREAEFKAKLLELCETIAEEYYGDGTDECERDYR